MEGLATRDDAKEAVESIAATTGIWVGMAEEPGSKSESVHFGDFGMFWQVNALRSGDVTNRNV